MKKRTGFVSNSSSSSFIIKKAGLTEEQLEAVRNHKDVLPDDQKWDAYNISENKEFMVGDTMMDNFDISDFLYKLNIPAKFGDIYEFEYQLNNGE